jgi:riboflavin-specific deaminase-like protein
LKPEAVGVVTQAEQDAGQEPVGAAWLALLAAAGRGASGAGAAEPTAAGWLRRDADGGWQIHPDLPQAVGDLISLYLPLCTKDTDGWVVGHLGQSLDGCIATHGGESCFVTGPDNILHLHRMRALCDAVIVGASTVVNDDPRLTTRLVPGPSPVRVVLDPRGRLAAEHRLFQDEAAPTLLCTAEHARPKNPPGEAGLLVLPTDDDDRLQLDTLVTALAARGLTRLFVEGGGVTVSRFLAAGLLSRLQIAVAPLIIGQGRPGLSLPRTERLEDALRLAPRVFRMGADMLYDLDLTPTTAGQARGGTVTGATQDPRGVLSRVL